MVLQRRSSFKLLFFSLKCLSENLKVRGSLVINKSAICSLPEDLEVIQDLIMPFTDITFLPNNLTLEGYLDLTGSAITSLPKNLKVGAISSDYFDKSDFLAYKHKALKINKKLSKDFDISALEDF